MRSPGGAWAHRGPSLVVAVAVVAALAVGVFLGYSYGRIQGFEMGALSVVDRSTLEILRAAANPAACPACASDGDRAACADEPEDDTSKNYDEKYWSYQVPSGRFGGKAEAFKFRDEVAAGDTVLDFGAGGGFVLTNLKCARRIAVEVNPVARRAAQAHGNLEVYARVDDVPKDANVDVVISNHCLEHVARPLDQLKKLRSRLRPGGKIVLVVPVDAVGQAYTPSDENHHLYTWNSLLLGNLLSEAGFSVTSCQDIQYKWPSNFEDLWNRHGEEEFQRIAHDYAVSMHNYQVKCIATNPYTNPH
jgi:SAM-dependent methyltransferase